MLKNYFLVALRHLKRQPGYALLNILGLTIGIASALLIVLYLDHELSFDTYHEKADQVYRISTDFTEPDNSFRWASTQPVLGRTIKEEFQEVEQFTRFAGGGDTPLSLGDKTYVVDEMYLVDSTVFDVFTFNFLQGNKETALDAPNSIVISKSTSDKIFNNENPIGQTLKSENYSYKVTGIYEDAPENSHIIPGAMASFSTNQNFYSNANWGGWQLYTYVVINKNVDPYIVERRLNEEIVPKYVATIFDQFDVKIKYEIINIQDIHLYSDFQGEPSALGNIDYIYIFLAIAIFLVLIACINYMNLATARSMRRSLEVGIRKVMGAIRGALIRQFIVESILITLVAVVISLAILSLAIPIINTQLGTNLDIMELTSFRALSILLGILLFTGVLSGSYPAFYLSGFSPIKAIKGGTNSKRTGNVWIRRVLVGLQFAISIFMLLGTFIIYQQMQYVREADLGFDQDQVVSFEMTRSASEKWNSLRNKLTQNPNITNASTSTSRPGRGYGKNIMNVENNEGVMESFGIDSYGIDYDFFDVLNVEVVDGRNIAREYSSDTATAVLVNEAMVVRMNWESPIGKRFQFDQDSTVFHKVVGVVKNFHQNSLYNPIEAMLFIPALNNGNALVKIEGDLEEGINYIEASWNELFPETPLEYELLEQNFLEAYNEDKLRGQFFLGFALMMIIISGLGLLGLASFTAEQRTKEISVRKVLGADVLGLVLLLIKDFFWLIIFGAIPAFIIGYNIMNDWLSDFEYHTSISITSFILILIIVTVFVAFTTGFQAYRAATANPSEKLKYE